MWERSAWIQWTPQNGLCPAASVVPLGGSAEGAQGGAHV
jgi:hypothetical protein